MANDNSAAHPRTAEPKANATCRLIVSCPSMKGAAHGTRFRKSVRKISARTAASGGMSPALSPANKGRLKLRPAPFLEASWRVEPTLHFRKLASTRSKLRLSCATMSSLWRSREVSIHGHAAVALSESQSRSQLVLLGAHLCERRGRRAAGGNSGRDGASRGKRFFGKRPRIG